MSVVMARNNVFWLAAVVAGSFVSSAGASVHATYDILQKFNTDGLSASWLYNATETANGSSKNGALLSGARSRCISGNLEGDLSGNVLSNASGSVSGMLKQLAGYLNGVFRTTSFTTSTPFALRLGELASGGSGAIKFETNGAGTGEFTGGFLDFSLFVDGSATSLLDGTFFFKPQAESGSATLSPNRGTSSKFSLWGWNWMHDGFPVGDTKGATEPNWGDFLSSVGYTGDHVYRTLPGGGSGITNPLGIALYVVDPDPPTPGALHNPEPAAAMIWGLLALLSGIFFRSQRT